MTVLTYRRPLLNDFAISIKKKPLWVKETDSVNLPLNAFFRWIFVTIQVVRFTVSRWKQDFACDGVAFFILFYIVDEPMNGSSYTQYATPQYVKTVQFSSVNLEPLNFEPGLRIFLHRLPTKRTETECWFQMLTTIGAGLTSFFSGLSPYPSWFSRYAPASLALHKRSSFFNSKDWQKKGREVVINPL